ncbi:hypothetical protein HTZ77_21325 [Nonomuraea sp. SMC257]|uniref:Secreted protein n=1 Tax=Nonomuraea montanisoli TaxID=2741721 RepID=A0A7Y6IBN5_9ACTN|nr:hypothetical protein [Nonomuraea montanisoli]NUW33954.1 hypothetical protein [Nonomuraea montanisoli]
MRSVLLAAATAAALLAPLPTPAHAATADVVCVARSWTRVDTVRLGSRRADLWKCKGKPYYHAGLTGGAEGDRLRVWVRDDVTRSKGFQQAVAGSDGRAVTRARVADDGDSAWVCVRPVGSSASCSKAHVYDEVCDDVETGHTRGTIPVVCRD